MSTFLLCDPALLMPVPKETASAVPFWTRLVGFAEDRRVRLGPAGYSNVLDVIGELGWPEVDEDSFPPGLGQLARRAISQALARVELVDDIPAPETLPEMSPAYAAHPPAGEAIAVDAATLHDRGLIGLATDHRHWVEPSNEVKFNPPPPGTIPLVTEAHQRLGAESDAAVAEHFAKRRLIIVGGVPGEHLQNALRERFAINDLRWSGSSPGGGINLDLLDGLRPGLDVVYCITGHIGHDGSTKAHRCCQKRGVTMRKVPSANAVLADLLLRFGGAESE